MTEQYLQITQTRKPQADQIQQNTRKLSMDALGK